MDRRLEVHRRAFEDLVPCLEGETIPDLTLAQEIRASTGSEVELSAAVG